MSLMVVTAAALAALPSVATVIGVAITAIVTRRAPTFTAPALPSAFSYRVNAKKFSACP